MEKVFGIICVILFLLFALGPLLRRWVGPMIQRWMLGKMEDRMRRMAGMPTRSEEKKARKEAARRKKEGASRFRNAAAGYRTQDGWTRRESVGEMMNGVAEDVEFTEIKSYSSEEEITENRNRRDGSSISEKIRVEEQVEDVEFVEIKGGRERE